MINGVAVGNGVDEGRKVAVAGNCPTAVIVQVGGSCLGVGVEVGKTRIGGKSRGGNGLSAERGLENTESISNAKTTVTANVKIVNTFNKRS